MSREVLVRNRHPRRRLNARPLRKLIGLICEELNPEAEVELGVSLVDGETMARLNWQFLRHEGATDVLTFDHTEGQTSRRTKSPARLHGELFVCLDEAVRQARQFQTHWTAETVRYVVHGILHLCGHDDQLTGLRRVMKREENRLMRRLVLRPEFRVLAR
jgi:probable rRNA maturation factor